MCPPPPQTDYYKQKQTEGKLIHDAFSPFPNYFLRLTPFHPQMPRHATQLDMLSKLKRMAPFTKDAEHEYLVNMYVEE